MNQKEIVNCLKAKGVSISHNYFSRAWPAPTDYRQAYKCDIPAPPVEYMGQKKGELGAAIRNLVYQAKEYDTFIDLFGGSGAATAAVMHLKGKEYIYNEVNPRVYSLFYLFVNTDCKKLIKAVKVLQDYIRTAEGVPGNASVISDAEWWMMGRNQEPHHKRQYDHYDEDRKAMFRGDEQWRCILSLFYFTHYDNLPMLDQAVGEVFRRYFSVRGNISVSTVMSRMRNHYAVKDFYNNISFEDLVPDFHKAIIGTHCRNKNCFTLINEDKTSDLYYVDPPYVDTSGYDEDGYGKFTTDDMVLLIKKLTKIKGKFIYSCRAVDSRDGGVKKINSEEKLEKTKRANRNIREFVFDVFDKNCQSDIYVLAIEDFIQKDKKLEKTLAQRIRNCEVVELM